MKCATLVLVTVLVFALPVGGQIGPPTREWTAEAQLQMGLVVDAETGEFLRYDVHGSVVAPRTERFGRGEIAWPGVGEGSCRLIEIVRSFSLSPDESGSRSMGVHPVVWIAFSADEKVARLDCNDAYLHVTGRPAPRDMFKVVSLGVELDAEVERRVFQDKALGTRFEWFNGDTVAIISEWLLSYCTDDPTRSVCPDGSSSAFSLLRVDVDTPLYIQEGTMRSQGEIQEVKERVLECFQDADFCPQTRTILSPVPGSALEGERPQAPWLWFDHEAAR